MKNDNNIEKPIISIITDYLKAKETDFALMINGAWGCGKTYFIKNTLESKIEEIPCPNKKNQKYKQIYVSLYGVSSIDEIRDRIFYEINPNLKWIDSISRRLISAAEAIPNGGNIVKDLLTTDKNEKSSIIKKITKYYDKVFVFDDLERIDFKSLDLQSVLGFINFLAEHNHCKIIVVANDGDLDEEYKQFKEKTIRFSYTYSSEKGEIFDNICEKYNDDYKQFLKEQKHFLLEILNAGKCENIRTLIFITDVFQKIFEKTKGEFSEKIHRDLLLPFTIISIEAKNGKTKENLKGCLIPINNLSYSSLPTNNDLDEEKNDPKEKEEILLRNKYVRFRKYNAILFYDILFDLVYEGYIQDYRLENIIESIRKEYIAKEGTEESKLVKQIIDWTQIPDEDFENVIKTIKEKVSSGKFDAIDLLKIYEAFIHIDAMKINDFTLTDNDTETFKSAIDNAMRFRQYLPFFDTEAPIWVNYDAPVSGIDAEETKISAEAKYNSLRQYALSINNKHQKEDCQAQINVILAFIKNNETERFREFLSDQNNKFLFLDIPPKDLISAIIAANAKTKQIFLLGLELLFPKHVTIASIKEVEFLTEIKKELDNYLNKQPIRKNSLTNLYFARNYINSLHRYL